MLPISSKVIETIKAFKNTFISKLETSSILCTPIYISYIAIIQIAQWKFLKFLSFKIDGLYPTNSIKPSVIDLELNLWN